jgi:hypothetical protein
VGRLTTHELSRTEQARALSTLAGELFHRAREAGLVAVAAGRWLTDEVIELAPRLVFRDADTLHRQYPDLTDVEIAERLVSVAKRMTAATGAAAGGLAAVEFVSPPMLLAAPVQLAAETLVVTALELKLVAELHEVMGFAAPGGIPDKASAYLMAWVRRQAVTSAAGAAGVGSLLGSAARKELRSHLMRSAGRNATSMAPFLVGAAAGAEVNRRATMHLGDALLKELRAMRSEQWFRQV